MAQHDGSTNTHVFLSPDHSFVTGQVFGTLSKELGDQYEVVPGTTENDDYLNYVVLTHRATRKRFQVLVTELFDGA